MYRVEAARQYSIFQRPRSVFYATEEGPQL